eukprot:CAMPEP_0197391048 /NCGR_PEP_ID=MMETSP1165-20131217/2828_1 /TAXON_ID=284809 /ORGANISM="Chrysocystis fragilis, Strain CCMP3189" /LENGTH=100 /DNA_ID=CAMNT_0042916587 /DNA_START=45 /DNA_END=347 /DNA_ORIENTATION=+
MVPTRDAELGMIRFHYNELPEEATTQAVEIATNALKSFRNGHLDYFQDVAKVVKENLEEKYSGSWHVVCGTSFGSHVTHESRNILFCSLGATNLLIFKHG